MSLLCLGRPTGRRNKTTLFQGSPSHLIWGNKAHPNYILIQDISLDNKIWVQNSPWQTSSNYFGCMRRSCVTLETVWINTVLRVSGVLQRKIVRCCITNTVHASLNYRSNRLMPYNGMCALQYPSPSACFSRASSWGVRPSNMPDILTRCKPVENFSCHAQHFVQWRPLVRSA